jgi:hypothetical protein
MLFSLFYPRTGFPATRIHLTIQKKIDGAINLIEEPSTRCSFTDKASKPALSDLDPRSPISVTIIFSDLTLPWVINQASQKVSFITLVTKALGLLRSLALLHI